MRDRRDVKMLLHHGAFKGCQAPMDKEVIKEVKKKFKLGKVSVFVFSL